MTTTDCPASFFTWKRRILHCGQSLFLLIFLFKIKSRKRYALRDCYIIAESEGFEPPVQLPVHLISSQARSTTPAAFLSDCKSKIFSSIIYQVLIFVSKISIWSSFFILVHNQKLLLSYIYTPKLSFIIFISVFIILYSLFQWFFVFLQRNNNFSKQIYTKWKQNKY